MGTARLFEQRKLSQDERVELAKINATMSYLIKGALREKNMTIYELAPLVPVSEPTMYKYVRKPDEMPVKIWRRVAEVLDLDNWRDWV